MNHTGTDIATTPKWNSRNGSRTNSCWTCSRSWPPTRCSEALSPRRSKSPYSSGHKRSAGRSSGSRGWRNTPPSCSALRCGKSISSWIGFSGGARSCRAWWRSYSRSTTSHRASSGRRQRVRLSRGAGSEFSSRSALVLVLHMNILLKEQHLSQGSYPNAENYCTAWTVHVEPNYRNA